MSENAIRVYVGSAESHRLLVEVLASSIRTHASREVEVHPIGALLNGAMPMPQKPENRPATPFSFQRFTIPELAGYSGRALYMDSDQLVLRDVAELHDRHMFGLRLLCRQSRGPDGKTARHISSVMLLDCARLDWSMAQIAQDLDEGRYDYQALMALKNVRLKGPLSRHWNALDWYEAKRTGLLHYTKRETQPWISRDHPHAPLWIGALLHGLQSGAVSQDTLQHSLDAGFVRPSLRWQVDHRMADPRQIPDSYTDADTAFFEHCRKNRFNNLDGDYRS